MKICSYCGGENDEAAVACSGCGTELKAPTEPGSENTQDEALLTSNRRGRKRDRIGAAILVTLGISIASGVLSALVHFPLILLITPATAVWATIEASKMHRKYKADGSVVFTSDTIATLQCSKPVVVFTVCFINWFFGFPWYLIMRDKLKAGLPDRKDEFRDATGQRPG